MGKRKSRRSSRKYKKSRKLRSRKSRKSHRKSRKSHRRRFGSGAEYGPGYVSDSGLPNSKLTPYFGAWENYNIASPWYYPVAGNTIQLPDMLYN